MTFAEVAADIIVTFNALIVWSWTSNKPFREWVMTLSDDAYMCHQADYIKTLRPIQNGNYTADGISKCFCLNENVWISIKISLKLVPKGPITNMPALVQIVAWRRLGDKPLFELKMVILPTHICVSRLQCCTAHSKRDFVTKHPMRNINFHKPSGPVFHNHINLSKTGNWVETYLTEAYKINIVIFGRIFAAHSKSFCYNMYVWKRKYICKSVNTHQCLLSSIFIPVLQEIIYIIINISVLRKGSITYVVWLHATSLNYHIHGLTNLTAITEREWTKL